MRSKTSSAQLPSRRKPSWLGGPCQSFLSWYPVHRESPSKHTLSCNHLHVMLQVLYRAKDLDPEPRSHVVRGNHTQSALLAGLRKFVVYELQVLAFTRIGNGVPSSPLILERTKDDSKCMASPAAFWLSFPVQTIQIVVVFNVNFNHFFFLVNGNKTKIVSSHWPFMWPI